MSESEKPDVDPNATIQLDVLDDVELEDSGAQPPVGEGLLPPAALAPVPGDSAQAKPSDFPRPLTGRSKKAAFFMLLLAMLGLAIAAGLSVGGRIRERRSAGTASGGEPSATGQAPTQAPSARTLTLPTVEIR